MSKKFSDLVNLERAYSEVLYDEQHSEDLLPDVLHFLDTKNIRTEILGNLKELIDNNKFEASELLKMDVPKANGFIRPAARPELRDWILYQALTDFVGVRADNRLGSSVYSSRFNRRTGKRLHWSEQWLKFERAFWTNFDRGYKHVLKTDITAYFCNISIERLRNAVTGMLDQSDESDRVVQFLFQGLLRTWAEKERNVGFGLPQGINASSGLSNLFLAHTDAILSRRKTLRYLRYADDMRILTKNPTDAKIALKDLIRELRGIGLDLNERKTQVLSGSDVERELRDAQQPIMATIQAILSSRDDTLIRKTAMPMITDLFHGSFDTTNPFSTRHLRFSVNCFVRLREVYADLPQEVDSIGFKLLSQFEHMPGSADTFSRFFSVFPRASFRKELVRFLKGRSNIYEWQEMHVLDSLLRFEWLGRGDLQVLRAIAFSGDKHPLSRSKAILALGKFGDEHTRYELMTRFPDENDYSLTRAIVVAVQRHSVPERNSFYSTAKRTDPRHAKLVDYVKPLREPVYYDPFVPSPISTVGEPY